MIVPGKRVVQVLALVFFGLAGLMIAARIYLPRYVESKARAREAACAEQLRAIGAAARDYAKDQQGFPHTGTRLAPGGLDGGPESSAGPEAFRALIAKGYLDDPSILICPAAPRQKLSREEREAQQAWLADGKGEPHALDESVLVTYGWARRRLDLSSPGKAALAADRAAVPRRGADGMRGNHSRGWNLLRVDGSVDFQAWDDEPFPGSWLTATKDPERDGFLGLREQTDPSVFDPRPN